MDCWLDVRSSNARFIIPELISAVVLRERLLRAMFPRASVQGTLEVPRDCACGADRWAGHVQQGRARCRIER